MCVGDDVQRAAVRLLTGGLDLLGRQQEAVVSRVSELEGVGEGDSLQTGPVPGRARVWVCGRLMLARMFPWKQLCHSSRLMVAISACHMTIQAASEGGAKL